MQIELLQQIPASVADTWRVLVDPDLAPEWLGGFRWVTTWEVGSPFAIEGTLDGEPYREVGTVVAFEAGRTLAYEHWSPLWRAPPEVRARLNFSLEADGDGTRLTLRQDLPEVEALAEHSRFFWRVGLVQLRRLVVERIP